MAPSEAGSRIARTLADNRLLCALSAEELAILAEHLEVVSYPANTTVIRQDDDDRDMYIVVEGRARVLRDQVDLGPIERSEHFGELALVDGAPRSASVVADTDLLVARLDLERYGALAAHHPALALRLAHAIIGGLAVLVRGLTEDIAALLRNRSSAGRTRVELQIDGERVEARTGTPLAELLPRQVGAEVVVAGLVDRRPLPLGWPVASNARVQSLTTGHWEGQRIYRASLGLLLLEAAHVLDPALRLQLDHSVGLAQRVGVRGFDGDHAELATRLRQTMHQLIAEDRPLKEAIWTVEEATAWFDDREEPAPAALLRTWRQPGVRLATFGAVQALQMTPLVPSAGRLADFGVVSEDHGLLLMYGREGTSPDTAAPENGALEAAARSASSQAREMTHRQDLWLDVLDIGSVGDLNRACVAGRVSEVIRVVEGDHERRVIRAASAIHARPDCRVVCVAGPSSAGKTTFIKRLLVQLQVLGRHPVLLSLDDYYVDRTHTPRDADGEYDYEAFEALRGDLLTDHLAALLRGEPVRTARYDFRDGVSQADGGPELHLRGDADLLLVEGIHGLNPKLLPTVDPESVFRVFVCPLAQLPFDSLTRVHASDVRLLRRIVRDRYARGANAEQNIARWPSVRRGERHHIFPHQRHADAVFDSSLVYELSVLKVYAERYLLEVPQSHPSYTTAFRLLGLLERFVTIYPDHVPPTSILREFIGGSGFRY